ncbi:LppU/SCO3897 family protein [Streptomyces sp. NPDC002446]
MSTPPQGPNPYGQAPYGQQPYGQNPYPQAPPPPQAPYGQPQGGYAYPQQPQAPYGYQQPQPGYPAPPQQSYGQPGAPVPPPPQPAKRRSPKGILKAVGVVIALIVCAFFWFTSLDDASNAEAGDCVKKSSSALDDGLEVVDCGSGEVDYKVTKVHDGTSDPTVCAAGEDAYVQTVQRRRRADTAMVLCLTPSK